MVIESASSLVETIRELGLLDPVQSEMLADLTARYTTPRDLGRHLIQCEWLTAFQVNQVLQGRGAKLLLGPYALLERIGAGGMGEVFKVRHRKLHRIAAVKVIAREKLDNPIVLQRFRREAEAAAKLSHPHIVAVHDAGEHDEVCYLAMEYIDGIDLANLLHRLGPLPVSLACDFIRQAALGLQHAHEQDFVHRDIKPQNLLAAPRGGLGKLSNSSDPDRFRRFVGATVKVLDMGLVQREADRVGDTEMALTQKGLVIGTMDYLAPEQARNSHRVDRRADLYSLGCTLYHVLAGRPPFPGGMALDKLLRHQTETPAALRTFRGDVPGELQLLVSRLLAKSPEDRMQSAAEVAVTLVPLCVSDSLRVKRTRTVTRSGSRSSSMAPTRVLPVEPVPAAASAPEDDEAAPLIRPRSGPTTRARRWRWRFAGVAGVALLLALVFLVGGSRKNASAPVAKEATKSPVPAKDHLANHVPPDSVAFSSVRLREIRESAIFRKIGQPRMSLDPVTQSLAQMLRIDPDKDLDEVRSSVSATSEGSIWTARGAFDSGKFVRGTELTSLARHEGDELFRVRPTGQSPSYLGVRGEYLIGGLDRKRIEAMLAQTRLGSALPVADADLSKLLDVVERKRSLWFVAVPPRLPATPQVSDARPAQNVVSYLLDRAATLEGGARFGRSLEVSLTLEGRTPRASREMALHLNWVKLLASSASVKGEPSLEKRLWMLLLRNLEVTTTDRGIHVRALVTPEMLD